jgi:hypothetical protein
MIWGLAPACLAALRFFATTIPTIATIIDTTPMGTLVAIPILASLEIPPLLELPDEPDVPSTISAARLLENLSMQRRYFLRL